MKTKIGLGFDIHRLKKGVPLYLGGVEIPFHMGLAGHSDGDCLIHAMIDALLGAVGEGDIGQLFPDTETKYKGMRSTELLKHVSTRLSNRKVEILHVDSIIIAEKPRLTPFIPSMKEAIGSLLQLEASCLGIKAKTFERMGAIGKGKAIAAWATALALVSD